VQLLASVLRVSVCRRIFFDNIRGMNSIVDLIKRNRLNPQMLYQCCFCLWVMSFDPSIAADLDREYDVIPVLIETAKAAIKEKVIRVIIATFRNLVELAIEANVGSMLVHRLLPFMEALSGRKWADEEIPNDIEIVKVTLEQSLETLSSYDAYVTELESGKLEWTPAHISEEFWKQNATRLNERDLALLRILAKMLATSNSPTVLAVAAHDIGQYVKYFPHGKKNVQKLGAKQKIMELMTHEDSEVRYQALLAVQKYMVHAWD